MTEQQQGLAALGATPVPGDNPAGISIRYEPEFESIETEINKLQSVHQEQVNWDSIIATGSAILGEKSKDLTVACYMCLALFEKEGYTGLATGLQILHGLITHFWDGMFPELRRLRARAGAISWLAEKLGTVVAGTPPGGGDGEAVNSAFQLVGEIDTRLGEVMQGQDYSLMDLYRPLKEFQRDLQQRDVQQQAKPAQSAPAGGGGASAAPADLASVAVGTKEEAQKVTRGCQAAIKTLAAFLRQQKLSDPAPYRMLRFSAWISIDRLPPNNNGETQLPAAAGEKRVAFQSLLDAGDYTKLVNDAEEMLTRAPFWLDVHRYTASALQELGDEYKAARAAVVSALGEFVRRLPGLLELSFQGGTPFADEATRAWIESEVQAAAVAKDGAADAQPTEQPAAAAEEPWMEQFKQAKQLKAKKKIKEALELFQIGRRSAPNERERFLWDLTQARFCYESGLVELALPQLDHLDRQIERFSLEEWEPGLSISVARLILMCNDKSSEATKNRLAGMADRVERARVRLYRLDPSSALDLQKK